MIDGFKKFISRGSMIDMAVGVVMGTAVTAVVTSIVNNFINPLIAMIFGKPNMDGLLAFTFNNATISFGAILSAVLNFLLIAVAVYFCILVPINKFRDMSAAMLAKRGVAASE
ncbi:MscL family protein, partial [uncultured Bifidobacterium sp.]|uniref:MscL family protein n=1 Tax=uncultured Bifidobacterium sp. TaxID=165187 RepID=UPI002637BBFD